MAGDDRSGPASRLSPAAGSESVAGSGTQTASFSVGALELLLSAAPGAARLVVIDGEVRDIYVVEPTALATWAGATRKLLGLAPALGARDAVEYRGPFLVDREGRASIAFEGHVAPGAVTYRLLVSGAASRVAGLMTSEELVQTIVEAAAGAVGVARSIPG
ncbi:MAG TPA: hypothetical protein VM076_19030 [Gemmatimonadaceae bacterium]|nr:hypothetical protein [Gemmatimonadaceae bacterium]